MKLINLLRQFNQNPLRMKITIIVVLLIWSIPLVLLMWGLILFYTEQPSQALERGQVMPSSPTPTALPVIVDWRGEYYSNRDLAGPPALTRNDLVVDFNWGFGSPAPGLPADDFSARWTRTWNFSEGIYRFHIMVDEGARLYVDNELVIDSWQDGGRRTLIAERWLWSGNHSLCVEYYEYLDEASIRVWTEKISGAVPEADFDASPNFIIY